MVAGDVHSSASLLWHILCHTLTSGPMAKPAEEVRARSVGSVKTDPRVDRTRAAVLETVRAILVEEGWDAVTHVRVAKRSGVGRRTIYRHWPQRTTLLRDALVNEAVAIHAAPSGDLRRDLLAELEAIREELVDRDMGRVLAALVDRAEWDPELHRLKVALVKDGFAVLRQLLQGGMDRGELRHELNVDHGIAQLVGPIIYRRLISAEVISSSSSQAVVDDFLAAHRRRRRP